MYFILILYPNADNQNPSIVCPDNVVIGNDPASDKAYVDLPSPYLADNSDTQVVWQSDNPSQMFPIGDNLVTYTAYDKSDNQAQCSFILTVQGE